MNIYDFTAERDIYIFSEGNLLRADKNGVLHGWLKQCLLTSCWSSQNRHLFWRGLSKEQRAVSPLFNCSRWEKLMLKKKHCSLQSVQQDTGFTVELSMFFSRVQVNSSDRTTHLRRKLAHCFGQSWTVAPLRALNDILSAPRSTSGDEVEPVDALRLHQFSPHLHFFSLPHSLQTEAVFLPSLCLFWLHCNFLRHQEKRPAHWWIKPVVVRLLQSLTLLSLWAIYIRSCSGPLCCLAAAGCCQ